MTNRLKLILSLFLFNPVSVFALENQTKTSTDLFSQKLTQSLSELRNSVEQLSKSNEDLALRNSQFKTRLNGLQASFQKLMEENQQLNASKGKLQESNSTKVRQITQLEKTSVDLDFKMGGLRDQLKITQSNIDASKKEDQQLSLQIAQTMNQPLATPSDVPSAELSQLWEQKQKEKLAILKMTSESQMHQKLLHEKILDFQKNVPVANVKQGLDGSRKIKLESEIQQLQEDIGQLGEMIDNDPQSELEDGQLRQMQMNIADLEKNRDELRDLVVKMQQKAQRIPLTKDQKNEQMKLQSNIVDLKREFKDLKFDLQDLQQQMVELDKRKTYLEVLLKK